MQLPKFLKENLANSLREHFNNQTSKEIPKHPAKANLVTKIDCLDGQFLLQQPQK